MRLALLGTGKMGAAIARRLAAAGHELTLWNRTSERARAVGVGRVAATPAEAAAGAEVVLSIPFGPAAVRSLLAGLEPAPGQVYCEMSTSGAAVLEEAAPRFAAAGAALLAAPILGSMPAVERGAAVILAGGDAAAFERARPALEAIGEVRHVGGHRDAAGLKLVSNAMLGAITAASAELISAARREGLDPEAAFGLLCRFVPYLEVRRRGYLEGVHSPALFELAGMVKDMDLALEAGHRAGAAMPVAGLVRELFGAVATEHGAEEPTAVLALYEARGGGR